MVIEARRNLVVLGERFDASLDDIDLFFRSRGKRPTLFGVVAPRRAAV